MCGLLDDLGLSRVRFCALSLGGMVGMWLASRAPDRVERLVICCSSPRIEPASLWTDRAADVRANGTASMAEQIVVARWFTPAFAARAPEVVAGAEDPATPLAHAEGLVAGIPGARLAVVADAAHLANVEQPEPVTRLLLDHLTGHADA